MRLSPTYKMPFKRRLEGKTDYNRRLGMLKSKKPRLVVRKSLKYIRAQLVDFDKVGDKTVVAASSQELKKRGWKFATDNLPAAYLTGLMIGKRALKKGIKEAILDTGLYKSTKGSRIYATAKGAIDAGLKIPLDQKILPNNDRISGKHITTYSQKAGNLTAEFEKIKAKIE